MELQEDAVLVVELTEEETAAVARAADLPLAKEDRPEVTIRVNAFLEGLRALDALPLDEVQPVVSIPHPRELS